MMDVENQNGANQFDLTNGIIQRLKLFPKVIKISSHQNTESIQYFNQLHTSLIVSKSVKVDPILFHKALSSVRVAYDIKVNPFDGFTLLIAAVEQLDEMKLSQFLEITEELERVLKLAQAIVSAFQPNLKDGTETSLVAASLAAKKKVKKSLAGINLDKVIALAINSYPKKRASVKMILKILELNNKISFSSSFPNSKLLNRKLEGRDISKRLSNNKEYFFRMKIGPDNNSKYWQVLKKPSLENQVEILESAVDILIIDSSDEEEEQEEKQENEEYNDVVDVAMEIDIDEPIQFTKDSPIQFDKDSPSQMFRDEPNQIIQEEEQLSKSIPLQVFLPPLSFLRRLDSTGSNKILQTSPQEWFPQLLQKFQLFSELHKTLLEE